MGSTGPLETIPAKDTRYFTPAQDPPTGTALSPNPPTLFTPIKIRDVTFQNRMWVAPMCMYSAENGHLTDYHLVHLSAFSFRGASLTIIEATSVQPNGGISPNDSGIWLDSHIAPIARIATFTHSQGQKLGIQLAHAGRKASTVAPWLAPRGGSVVAEKVVGGWPDDVVGPSAIKWGEGYVTPRELTIKEIETIVEDFAKGAQRAVKAGVDVIEIHAAHGYLLASFLSPLSNTRTDIYGGSFEGRVKIVLDVIKAIRAVIPEGMPLFVRVSATEWVENGGWDIDDTIRFAKLLPALGVDLIDVSSGGNSKSQKIRMHGTDQIGLAGQVRAAVPELRVAAVGMITEAEQARGIVDGAEKEGVSITDENGVKTKADVVLAARQFLREPEWVLRTAHKLGVEVNWPLQYGRAAWAKGQKI